MDKKYNNWLDFILQNAEKTMPGTATEVAIRMEKIAEEEGFMPDNKNKKAKIFQLPPVHTEGVMRMDTRKLLSKTFININGIYDLPSRHIQPGILELNSSKEVNVNKDNEGKKITIETPKDKSIKHSQLLKLVKDYAIANNIEHEVEKHNIDILAKDNDKFIINEIKTYKESIYVAVGQVQFYKHNLIWKIMFNFHYCNIYFYKIWVIHNF